MTRVVRLLVVAALLLVPAAAHAQGLSHAADGAFGDEPQGITLTRAPSGELVFRFAPDAGKWRRQVAGKRVRIDCQRLRRVTGGSVVDRHVRRTTRAPATGRRLPTGILTSRLDLCQATVRGDLVLRTARTRLGRTHIDEGLSLEALLFPYPLTVDDEEPPPLTTESAVADGQGFVVALAGPDGTPPKDKVGFWTDGTRTVSVFTTPQGRRVFLSLGPADAVATNLLPYVAAFLTGR